MDMRPLGRTGLTVSSICLGTMTWGQQNTEAEGHAQMDYALDRGINFFDTAELYSIPPKAETQGSTERIIGTWFKSRKTRDKVILATKVVGRSQNNWFRDDGGPTDLSRKQIFEAVDKSLSRLQTDYIDLYQLHWPDRAVTQWGSNPTVFKPVSGPEVPVEETLEALHDLVKAGKVRHIGLSNESAWGVMRFLTAADTAGSPRVASVQNAYNLLNRLYEVNLAEISMRENVGLLPYSPLAQGVLSGKYRNGAMPQGSRKQLFNRGQRYETPGTNEAVEKYWALAEKRGIDLAQMAIKFCETRPFVASVIIGATTLDQLRTDIDAVTLPWSDDLEAEINAIHQIHCNPCP